MASTHCHLIALQALIQMTGIVEQQDAWERARFALTFKLDQVAMTAHFFPECAGRRLAEPIDGTAESTRIQTLQQLALVALGKQIGTAL